MVAAPNGVRWNATHRITSRRVRARACAVPSSVVKRFTMAANASASTSTSTFGTARVFALAVFFVVIARRPRQTCRQLALVVRLTIRLSRYSTIAWVFKLMGLIVYAAVLSPAFVRRVDVLDRRQHRTRRRVRNRGEKRAGFILSERWRSARTTTEETRDRAKRER